MDPERTLRQANRGAPAGTTIPFFDMIRTTETVTPIQNYSHVQLRRVFPAAGVFTTGFHFRILVLLARMTIAVDYGVYKPLKTRAAPGDGPGIQRSGDVFRYAGVVDPVSE